MTPADLDAFAARATPEEQAALTTLAARLLGLKERCATWDDAAKGLTVLPRERQRDAALAFAVRACVER